MYLDILGKIILNQCDKYLLPALFEREETTKCRGPTDCSSSDCFCKKRKKLLRRSTFLFAVKMIKRLLNDSCQTITAPFIRNSFYDYKLWKDCFNPYLSIDRPYKKKEKDE